MKVILNYGSYFNQGKQYQVKFLYEDIDEIKTINKLIQSLSDKSDFHPYEAKFTENKKGTPIIVIGGTNIPTNDVLPFIKELITQCDAKIIIGNQEFTNFDLSNITNALDNLRININIKKGKYFNFKDCYYATIKYATDEQREEISFDFNVNLTTIMAQNYTTENDNYIFPFIIDRNGNMTGQNTGIIGGTNIPEKTLPFFIARFIYGYDAVVTIGNEKFKDQIDNSKISKAIESLEKGRAKTYKPEKK